MYLLNKSYLILCLAGVLSFLCCSEEKKTTDKSFSTRETPINPKETLFKLKDPEETGISFRNDIVETAELNYLKFLYAYNGGGVSVGDINNDGLLDIFFTSNMGESKLYLNNGDLKFEDISKSSGMLSNKGWTTGSTLVDINYDGLLDIYVCNSGIEGFDKKNQLYINNGNLSFTESAKEYGLDIDAYSTQASFFDYDLDGDLDVYIVNHLPKFPKRYADQSERSTDLELKYSDRLLRNNGKGNFIDVTESAGLLNKAFGLNASVSDFNDDGYPDIYVTSDFREDDFLYINQKNGRFLNEIKSKTGQTSQYSMGSDVGDINNDGRPDIMVVDMSAEDNFRHKMMMGAMAEEDFRKSIESGYHYQYMYNSLQLNRGKGYFSNIAMMANVAMTDWSWAPLFADYDGDGLQDLYVTNGIKRDVLDNDYRFRITQKTNQKPGDIVNVNLFDALDTYTSTPLMNYMFKSKGKFEFQKVMNEWGLTEEGFSNGAMYGDLDNDGDLDLIVNNIDGAAFVYENQLMSMRSPNYLKISLTGSDKNSAAIGAKLIVEGVKIKQSKEFVPTRSYLSSYHGPQLFYFPSDTILTVKVKWPDGNQTILTDVKVNQNLSISYEEVDKNKSVIKNNETLLKYQKSGPINYTHKEKPFDDMSREVLIPHKLSSNGPYFTVGDLNGDKLDDLIISGSAGYPTEILLQTKQGKMKKTSIEVFSNDAKYEDGKGVLFDFEGDGDLDVFIPSTSNEFIPNTALYQDRIYINDGKANFTKFNKMPDVGFPTSTVAFFDFDEDGDLDCFLGAESVPASYGISPRSSVLLNDNGGFIDVTDKLCPQCHSLGMIKSAEWVQLEKDNSNVLLIAGEWTGLMAFSYENEKFVDRSSSLGLDNTKGWWFTMHKTDFDNDGDEDFIIGNLGLNYKYKSSYQIPFSAYIHDFDNRNGNDIILSYHQYGVEYPVRGRNCSMQQMPGIQKQFPNYSSFANASLRTIYGAELDKAKKLEVQTFESIIVINGPSGFRIKSLPKSVQLSAVKAIHSADINRDGNIDLILAGNHYDSEAETPRSDAGYGQVLLGDGKSKFSAKGLEQSGLLLKGETRSINTIVIKQKQYIMAGLNKADIIMYEIP